MDWLDHPAVQGGIAPLIVALIVGTALRRTRFAWLAVGAGYLATLVLSGDFAFDPLTASRKVMLVGLVCVVVGAGVDKLARRPRGLAEALSVIVGVLSTWVFFSVFRQGEGWRVLALALGLALFIGLMTRLVLALRDDGIRTGAAGLGLGVATGVAGVLSASLGYLLGGMSIAAASGAMLLVQLLGRRSAPAGYLGALPIGVLTAYFAAATYMLAQLPWYALLLLLAVPLAASLRLPKARWSITRAAVASSYALAAALLPIAAAWYAARGSFT